MLKPLTKVSRYGNIVEVLKFEKPVIRGSVNHSFQRRRKGRSTFKSAQNIWRTKRRVRRFVSIVTQMAGTPAFVTFTYAQAQHDIQKAIEDWRQFTRKMKKHYPDAAFLRVPERHKSGAVHFHAVIFGLGNELPCESKKISGRWKHTCPANKQCERKQRKLAKLWNKGFVDAQQTRSPESIGAYIAKYLTKGDPDWSMFGNHIASCNSVMYDTINKAKKAGVYWELSSFSAPMAVQMAIEDILPRSDLRNERTFTTKWLGDAKYSVYTIKDG